MSASTVGETGAVGWRTPMVVVVCGCLIAMVSFGPRSSLGFFLTPLSQANHWGRDVFSVALAIQNLLWGIGQPLAGGVADRFGANRVMMVGAALYALGLALMAHATTPGALDLTAGVLIGFGLSGCSFTLVVGAFGKLLPPSWRSVAFGGVEGGGDLGLVAKLSEENRDEYSEKRAHSLHLASTGRDHNAAKRKKRGPFGAALL